MEELSKIKGFNAQTNALKHQMNAHVKGLRWKECQTIWLLKDKLLSVQHVEEYLMNIAQYSNGKNKNVEEPNTSSPTTKNFPTLGDARAKTEEDANDATTMNEKCK